MQETIDFDVIDESGPQTFRGTYDFAVSDLDRPELAAIGGVAIEVRVDVGGLDDEYVADGTVTYTTDLSCSRCVEPYPFANASAFHVRFRPRPVTSGENEEVEITDSEELDVEFYSERAIPLRDLALEQIQLTIPMKPLCDENCLGLCPTCGVNRVRESCACATSVTDERWGALKDIKAELAKKKDV